MARDPLHRLASSLSLAGRPILEVGIFRTKAALVPHTRLGEVSRLLVHNHVGSLVEGVNLDVLLLPVDRALPVEGRILKASQGGASPEHIARGFPLSVRRARRSAWNFLIACLVNYLILGLSVQSTRAMRAYLNQALLDPASGGKLKAWHE